jgi:hypothetical protein
MTLYVHQGILLCVWSPIVVMVVPRCVHQGYLLWIEHKKERLASCIRMCITFWLKPEPMCEWNQEFYDGCAISKQVHASIWEVLDLVKEEDLFSLKLEPPDV